MLVCKCIKKFRDNNNKIYGYRLEDFNGNQQDVKPENLKNSIRNNQIQVVNLTLTSDNRLIDASEELLKNSLTNKDLGPAPKLSINTNSVAKAIIYLEREVADKESNKEYIETVKSLCKNTNLDFDYSKTSNNNYLENLELKAYEKLLSNSNSIQETITSAVDFCCINYIKLAKQLVNQEETDKTKNKILNSIHVIYDFVENLSDTNENRQNSLNYIKFKKLSTRLNRIDYDLCIVA